MSVALFDAAHSKKNGDLRKMVWVALMTKARSVLALENPDAAELALAKAVASAQGVGSPVVQIAINVVALSGKVQLGSNQTAITTQITADWALIAKAL